MLYLKYALLIVILAAAVAGAVYLCCMAVKKTVFPSDAGPQALTVESLRAAGASLGLFFGVQSGIHRYIGLDLFAPVQAGQPLVSGAVIFFLCVAVSFGAAMTEKGRMLRAKFTAACDRDWVRWLTALAVVGLFFLWATRVTVFSYMTNDDPSLIRSIVRVPEQGLAAAGGAFANVLFCGLISLFYRLDPDGLWYFGYHLFAILGSAVIIGRCILIKARSCGLSALSGCLIHLLLCAGLFLYTLAQLSFTVTPAVVGSAAVALVLCRDELKNTAGRAASDIGCIILMLLCFLHRKSTGQALLCFWALAVAYAAVKIILSRAKGWKRRLTALSFSAVCLLGLCAGADAFGNSIKADSSYDSDYWNAEHYRSIVMDYMSEDLTPEQWESVGIPRELGVLVQDWYFMDERINTDTFKALTDKYYEGDQDSASEQQLSSLGRLAASVTDLFDSLWSSRQMRCLTALALCLLMLCAVAFFRGRCHSWPELISALCAVGGFLLLCLYLVYEGRFLVRVFLVVAIPAIVSLLLLFLSAPGNGETLSPRKKRVFIAAFVLFGLAAGFFCLRGAWLTPYASEPLSRAEVFAEQRAIEEYIGEHPDLYFISNPMSENLDPARSETTPDNIGLWGGTGVTASEDRLYADAFFRDDIRLMYTPPSTILGVLRYLTLDHGPVQAALEQQLSARIAVCRISQVAPGENYTGWYEQNGMRYYFENGVAVTGKHTIDGMEYEFAPAGENADFTVVNGADGIIYTTTAYTLIESE